MGGKQIWRRNQLITQMRDSGDLIALGTQILHMLPNGGPGHIQLLANFFARNIAISLF